MITELLLAAAPTYESEVITHVERAEEMARHENGFGGDVAHYIVTGEARKGWA